MFFPSWEGGKRGGHVPITKPWNDEIYTYAARNYDVRRSSVPKILSTRLGLILAFGTPTALANPTAIDIEEQYSDELGTLKTYVSRSLPLADERKSEALENAREEVLRANLLADAAAKQFGRIDTCKALVAHAKGKWIGGAEKGIATANAALAKATNAAERAAAEKDLASWEANRKEGEKALAERQAALDAALRDEPRLRKANHEAQAALAKAKENESKASKDLLASLGSVLTSDAMDAKLAKAVVLTAATPKALGEFAAQGADKAKLLDNLLASPDLMKEMLIAGGANHGQYGRTLEILAAIEKASPMAITSHFKRLALATALEHSKPIENIDPVKRYLHYEKAYLDGELDPAFKTFTTWEYRHVVNCDAPDEILQWGRTMLRTYRPDHIHNPDYGWRYVSSVRTEVPYGSQNVQFDKPELHKYQNIIMNGGVCGRRAFFGRFILRSFGIPTWGVTQKAHAALSHWTPKGWVVNLGAGFGSSWWDKDEVPLGGNQFLMETQARAHSAEYIQVLRAQWISRILGEPAYNERRKVEGGFWSRIALYQSRILASSAASLDPLGQELAEANEKKQKEASAKVSGEDRKITVNAGEIYIPAVAQVKSSGKGAAMRSIGSGMQLHALGGFAAEYEVTVPVKGKYLLTARVATVQTGQKMLVSKKGGAQPSPMDMPYTFGMWEATDDVELDLAQGKNTISVELAAGSRGVTIKNFILTSAK
ncbi:MAG: hypothetical protein RLZZ505_478 [Verrucomicrobiota bacterium]|jgi:hypothetical protein